MFEPNQLTGALVEEIRTRHKLSRTRFSELAGFTGKSTARLCNIERKESWKTGDRERVAAVLDRLEPRFDPRYHATTSAASTTDGVEAAPVTVTFVDDDPDDGLVDVLPATPTRTATSPPPVVTADADETTGRSAIDPAAGYPVSNSEIQTWKRCRRKWWLAWYRQLALREEAFVGIRAVGDRVHRALQAWYVPEGQPRVDPRDALERVVVEDWTRIAAAARERDVDEDKLAALAAEFGQSTNLERAMVEGYVGWLEETGADAELRVIAAETSLTAPLEVDVSGQPRPIQVIGKLDVRTYRVTDEVRLFLDHKTVADLKSPVVTLPQNEQMTHYMLLEWLNTPDGEARCDGALYNMLRRVKRTPRAQPPFYDRVEVRHNRFELESYKRRLLATTRDVLHAVDRLDRGDDPLDVVYPSPRSECRWDCDFQPICNLFDDGSAGVDDMVNVLYHRVDPRARYDTRNGSE